MAECSFRNRPANQYDKRVKQMTKYILITVFALLIFCCGKPITTESFVPEGVDGLININIQEILNSEFYSSILEEYNNKIGLNPLQIFNKSLQNNFGFNTNDLYNTSIFFINETDTSNTLTAGIILEIQEIDSELIFDYLKLLPGLEKVEYNDHIYFYSELLDSCISFYNNFIFYSDRDNMEKILNTIEEKTNKNEDLNISLKPLKQYPIKGLYQLNKNEFIDLNKIAFSKLEPGAELISVLESIDISNEQITFTITADITNVLRINLIIQFFDKNAAALYLEYLNSIISIIIENLSKLNTSGQFDTFIAFINNIDIFINDGSISIYLYILHDTFLSLFAG